MKLKIFISKEKFIIFLFLATYIYCNLVSLLLFPSEPKIFIITKIIPLILISLLIFPIKKILLNSVSKVWFSSYFFFILVCLISAFFSENQYISFRVIFINFCLTLPLIIFHTYINSENKFKMMIRIITIFYLLICSVIIYSGLSSDISTSVPGLVGIYSKGAVTNLGLTGLTLLLLEKKIFKIFLIIIIFFISYLSLSVKFNLLVIVFLISIIISKKKILIPFLIFLTLSYIFLSDLFFSNLLNYIENSYPEYYSKTIQRILALFGSQDVSNYALSDVHNNIEIRKESLKLFFNNPVFGIGLENERTTFIGTMAHSGFISILIGTGIIGFCFFYFFIFYILSHSIKFKYDEVIIICIMYLFYSISNPVYSNPNTVLILFIASSLFALRRSKILN